MHNFYCKYNFTIIESFKGARSLFVTFSVVALSTKIQLLENQG